jgi:hypothetical protein
MLEKECTKAEASILGSAKLFDQGVGGAAELRAAINQFLTNIKHH